MASRTISVKGGVFSLASMGAVLAGMAALDESFRQQVTGVLTGEPSVALASAGVRVQQMTHRVTELVGYRGTEDATLAVFALGAAALVLLMMRT